MNRNLIRGVAVGLIALPEPFTTPVGVALLFTSIALDRSKRRDTNRRIEESIKRYVHNNKPLSFPLEKPIISHKLKTKLSPLDMVIPGDPRLS